MLQGQGLTAKFVTLVSLLTLLLVAGLASQITAVATSAQQEQADSFVGLLKSEQGREEQLLHNGLLGKGGGLGDLLAKAGTGLIVGYDFSSLEQLVKSTTSDPDVNYVIFYGKDGNPLTTKPKGADANVEVVRKEIVFEGEKVGTVELGLSTAAVREHVAGLSKRVNELVDKNNLAMQASTRHTILLAALFTVVGVVILCLVIYFSLARLVVKPVNCIILGLNEGSRQMVDATTQISTVSHQLSEGAAEEAAAIEETSASLEEIATMTRQNAENAGQADAILKDANQVVGRANQTVVELTTSMAEISRASEETSKIIKTIDEIAFQTNLLALNAAVEAARAGEAGAGFAVVADEVRSLAMRAAEAARNTAQLIEGTVAKVQGGSALVSKTSKAFSEVADRTTKAGSIVSEITMASQEQSQGIGQVNRAMGEIDTVTQRTAMNAEEAAEAVVKMNNQAQTIEELVEQLVLLVNGNRIRKADGEVAMENLSRTKTCRVKAALKGSDAQTAVQNRLPPPAEQPAKPTRKPTLPAKAAKQKEAGKKSPQEVIPFDEENFTDF